MPNKSIFDAFYPACGWNICKNIRFFLLLFEFWQFLLYRTIIPSEKSLQKKNWLANSYTSDCPWISASDCFEKIFKKIEQNWEIFVPKKKYFFNFFYPLLPRSYRKNQMRYLVSDNYLWEQFAYIGGSIWKDFFCRSFLRRTNYTL